MNLKESLHGKLSKAELALLPRAFDIVGEIAILHLPLELKKRERMIGEELLKLKQVKTVVNKVGKFSDRLRKASYKVIAGHKSLETAHNESGCRIKLDISKVYFSPRLSADRLEIAKQVKKGEKILVLFAGVLPYALVIAKNSKASEILANELNKDAAKYAYENIKVNKLSNLHFLQGDAKKVAGLLAKRKQKFDRIVMPRPQLKETFLAQAFSVAKKGCVAHFHDFLHEEEIPAAAINRIGVEAKKAKRKIKILGWKKIGELAPHKFRVRIDFKIL